MVVGAARKASLDVKKVAFEEKWGAALDDGYTLPQSFYGSALGRIDATKFDSEVAALLQVLLFDDQVFVVDSVYHKPRQAETGYQTCL